MGRTAEGATVFAEDGAPDWVRPSGPGGVELAEVWGAGAAPILPVSVSQPGGDLSQLPPPGGTSFRLVRIEPEGGMAMHATETIDYLVVLSGEVALEPDGGATVFLRAGDCVVQLGGRHAWHNRGPGPCVLAAVIVGAQVRVVSAQKGSVAEAGKSKNS